VRSLLAKILNAIFFQPPDPDDPRDKDVEVWRDADGKLNFKDLEITAGRTLGELTVSSELDSGVTISLSGTVYWRLVIDAASKNLKVVPVTADVDGDPVYEFPHP
jgi:hypothetical protein